LSSQGCFFTGDCHLRVLSISQRHLGRLLDAALWSKEHGV
jgi:hypothetical protein